MSRWPAVFDEQQATCSSTPRGTTLITDEARRVVEHVKSELRSQLTVYGRKPRDEVLRHMARLEAHYFIAGDDEASGRSLRTLYIELLAWPVPRCEPNTLLIAWRELRDELATLA